MDTTTTDLHAEATRKDIHALVSELNEGVSTAVVQAITGAKDRGRPVQWASPDGPSPRADAEQRLRLAYRVWTELKAAEGSNVALAWLVGANPLLEERTPVSVIRDLDALAVVGAVAAFIDGAAAA